MKRTNPQPEGFFTLAAQALILIALWAAHVAVIVGLLHLVGVLG